QLAAVAPRVRSQQVGDDGAQGGVGGELPEVPAGEVVQPLAQVAAVNAQRAVEVAAELGQVAADVVLGEQQDVVAHAGEHAGEQLFLHLLGGAGQPLHEVVAGAEDTVEK